MRNSVREPGKEPLRADLMPKDRASVYLDGHMKTYIPSGLAFPVLVPNRYVWKGKRNAKTVFNILSVFCLSPSTEGGLPLMSVWYIGRLPISVPRHLRYIRQTWLEDICAYF